MSATHGRRGVHGTRGSPHGVLVSGVRGGGVEAGSAQHMEQCGKCSHEHFQETSRPIDISKLGLHYTGSKSNKMCDRSNIKIKCFVQTLEPFPPFQIKIEEFVCQDFVL